MTYSKNIVLRGKRLVAVDFETNYGSTQGELTEVYMMGVATRSPLDGRLVKNYYRFDIEEQRDTAYRILFESPDTQLCAHNASFDRWVAQQVFHKTPDLWCTMLMSYVDNTKRMSHALKSWGQELGIAKGDFEEHIDDPYSQEMGEYCMTDCEICLLVAEILTDSFDSVPGAWSTYLNIVMPISHVIQHLNHQGVTVDQQRISELTEYVIQQKQGTLESIFSIVPLAPGDKVKYKKPKPELESTEPKEGALLLVDETDDKDGKHIWVYQKWQQFNPGSNKQVEWALRRLYGWEPTEFTEKGNTKLDGDTLESLPYPLATHISRFNELEKLLTSFCRPLSGFTRANGRVYPSFRQNVTLTGRFSCGDPNFQQIPAHGEDAEKFRACIVPDEPDHVIVAIDLQAIEARVSAEAQALYSMERYGFIQPDVQAQLDGFIRGDDCHKVLASLLFDKPIEDITKEERFDSKTARYSSTFGSGPVPIAKQSGKSVEEAKALLDLLAAKNPTLMECKEALWEGARANGGRFTSLFGRPYHLPNLCIPDKGWRKSVNWKGETLTAQEARKRRGRAERQAFSCLIQGTAADLLQLLTLDLPPKFWNNDRIRVKLSVHDELLLSVHKDEVDYVVSTLDEVFCKPRFKYCPIEGKAAVGNSWLEVK